MKFAINEGLQSIAVCIDDIFSNIDSESSQVARIDVLGYLHHGRINAISTLSLANIMGIDGTETSKIRQVRKYIHEARKEIPICCNDNGYWLPEYDSSGILTEQGAIDVIMHYSKSIKSGQSIFEITQAERKALEAYREAHNPQISLFYTEGTT